MSAPATLESSLLRHAANLVHGIAGGNDEDRFQLLELAAAELGRFNLRLYYKALEIERPAPNASFRERGNALASLLRRLPIHPSIALTSLSRPSLEKSEQRNQGSYFTDFRLADALASHLTIPERQCPKILDPACGTGILLTAVALKFAKSNRKRLSRLLGESMYAADISRAALRGTALSLASLTDDDDAIASLIGHLRDGDSLLQGKELWADVCGDGFDVVVGNPPWEKLKLSRHEYLLAGGEERHYGDGYSNFPSDLLSAARAEVASYRSSILKGSALQGSGETDLYKLFLELAFRLTKPGGQVAFLVPGGLLRSIGTQALREFLLDNSSDLEFTVFENRARFFSIDTRFKFLALRARLMNGHCRMPVLVQHASGTERGTKIDGRVAISRKVLRELRPDLSIPEVRNKEEWDLFESMSHFGRRLGDSSSMWTPSLMREVDMTRDQERFSRSPARGSIPLLEGRMLHQYRHAAKRYVSGTGRRAVWRVVPQSTCEITPQYWYPVTALPEQARTRSMQTRIGFCDITGQTNERTMLAARIPSGVVCGNKVPTIVFPKGGKRGGIIANAWVAIANSFVFDWLLRRVVTTTVNYFLLLDLPFPVLSDFEADCARIALLASRLGHCEHTPAPVGLPVGWDAAEMRAEIEWRVLNMYHQGFRSLRLMLSDFPLLDREQRPIWQELRSSVTMDLVLLRAAEHFGGVSSSTLKQLNSRVNEAKRVGAIPFIPSQVERQLASAEG